MLAMDGIGLTQAIVLSGYGGVVTMTDTALKLQLDRIEGKLDRILGELGSSKAKLDTLLKRSNRWSTRKQMPIDTTNGVGTATVAQLQDPAWRKANGMDE